MVVRYLGHSCFFLNSSKGTSILVDPYGTSVPYKFPANITADVVIVTHEHRDHNATIRVGGDPRVVKRTSDFIVEHELPINRTGELLVFKGMPTHHDKFSGRRKGPNTIWTWIMEGLGICHLGDLGHTLTEKEIQMLGQIDVLFLPVGGGTVLDPTEAVLVMNQLNPKVIFPMHFLTPETQYMALAKESLEAFTSRVENVEHLHSMATNVEIGRLPVRSTVIILDYG
jgi:L-ascorbate metabolism protein UlaG (beta-lactamase superfamily)